MKTKAEIQKVVSACAEVAARAVKNAPGSHSSDLKMDGQWETIGRLSGILLQRALDDGDFAEALVRPEA